MEQSNMLYFRSAPTIIDTLSSVAETSKLTNRRKLLVISNDVTFEESFCVAIGEESSMYYTVNAADNTDAVIARLLASRNVDLPFAFICDLNCFETTGFEIAIRMQNYNQLKRIPFIVVSKHTFAGNDLVKIAAILQKTALVDDFYTMPIDWEQVGNRIEYLSQHKADRKPVNEKEEFADTINLPLPKRIFDIIFSLVVLIVFGPLMLLIALAIKLESKGPVLYKSKRAGAGYQVFDFYKFRSMVQTAEQELGKLTHLNQYASNIEEQQAHGNNLSFVKLSNDPRVTRVGWFIRKTSLDELPQLINVLKGDMSVVGNRPLPLYEAQQLTRDVWAKRFLAPAGITGLWQVTKRGKANMSAEERIQLDNDYAQNCSFKLDLLIILKTLPAMLQKEAV